MCGIINVESKKVEVMSMKKFKQQYQVTLMCASGQYKPVSCLVSIEQEQGIDLTTDKDRKKEIQTIGIQKICALRSWSKVDLKNYNYTKAKVRLYDKDKIDKENKERYERLKEEKYASGEWKRPQEKKED